MKIQEQPFRVLLLLLERPAEIVTREELKHHLWPEGTFVDFDGSLNVILKKLRSALDDDSENPRFIETVPRHGYRFIAPVVVAGAVEIVAPETPATFHTLVDRPNPGASTSITEPHRNYPLYILGAVALLVAIAVGLFTWRAVKSSVAASSAKTAPAVQLRKSLAVLGFHNVSGRVDDAWMSTAFSEMLSTELAGGEKLRLVSGEDVANLRASSPWSQTDTLDQLTTSRLGTALNSDLLVLGSYTTIGKHERGQLRVDVRLQDAKTGEILTEIAEIGGTEDIFRLVTRIGGKLRDRLGVPRLEDVDEAVAHAAALPSNPEAARFYSLGLAKAREYDYEAARGLFQQAIAAEPKFPLAHSMLSRADIFLGHDDQAKAEAKRGLDLAGNLPRVQKMEIEASYFHAIADRAKAAEIYRVLFNLFPDSLDYGLQLAKLQLESYHPDEALETIRQLRQLPPPARDDPGIDLREASILLRRDAKAADPLIHAAARKAQAQGKRLIYAKAEQALCSTNRQHLQDPPECHEAYDAYLAAGNRDQAGSTLQIMAENQRLTGHEPEAIPLYEQAIRTLKEAGDRENVGVALNNLSLIYENQGRWSQAEQAYVEAKQDFMAVNDKVNTFVATANLGDISMMRGKFKMAAATYQQSWELADSLKSTHDEYAHIQHAALLLMQGNLDEAAAEAEAQANSLRSWGGDPWQLANAIGVSGDIEKARGNLANARKKYEESMEILKKANASVANSQLSLAELSVAEGHPGPAERMVREAITEFEKDKSAGEELNGYLSLCKALLAEGKVKESEEAIAHAAKLTDLHEFPVLRMPLQLLGARVKAAAARGDRQALAAAEKEMRDVLQKAHEIGFYTEECEARLALGELEMGMNSKSARSHLSALASDANSRGLGLIAHQAELSANRTAGVLAVSQPAP